MKTIFVTYADLGKFKNLKTKDIFSTIEFFKKENLISLVISRLGVCSGNFKKSSVLPFFMHLLIGSIHKFFTSFPARAIEEKIFDFLGSQKRFDNSIVFFHPPKFPRIIKKAKHNKCICIGIAVNSSPIYVRSLLEKELKKQKVGLSNLNKLIECDYAKDMDYLITLSNFSKNTYIKDGFPAEKIYVANLDIDTNKFSPANIIGTSSKEFVVLFPASMIGVLKGLQYLIDAWQDLDIPNKKLIILGKRYLWPVEMEKKYKKIIKKDDSIFELGIVSNVEFYMRKSNLAILPSFTEGFSRSVAEAMSCGIPVITTDSSTDTNFFIDKKHGIIIPAGDSVAIKEAIMFLYKNKETLTQMGQNAREDVLKKKSFPEAVFSIYKDIVNKSAKTR